jgi:hypothetical protein
MSSRLNRLGDTATPLKTVWPVQNCPNRKTPRRCTSRALAERHGKPLWPLLRRHPGALQFNLQALRTPKRTTTTGA